MRDCHNVPGMMRANLQSSASMSELECIGLSPWLLDQP